jgi:hypothetical protein
VRGTWREGSFTGDPERYAKQGSRNVCLFSQEPRFWGTWRGRLPRAFERRDKFLYLGEFYKEFERYVKKGLVSGQLSSQGPVGEPGGVRLLGLLREKEKAYLGSSSVEPEHIKS